MKPLVSVIVLTFNSMAYIGRALSSLRRQSYPQVEIVVVDAGSVDSTKMIVTGFGDVVWVDLPQSDMGMARNHGVKYCRGEYLMFLDSDDFYLKHKIESQVAIMQKRPDLGAIFSSAYIYRTGKSDQLGVKLTTQKLLSFADFLQGNCYTLGTICIRRSVWDSGLAFGEGDLGRYGEDWRFQLSLARKQVAFDVLNAPAVVVEIREGSHTNWEIQPMMKALALASVLDAVASAPESDIRSIDITTIIDSYRFKLAVSLILVGRNTEVRRIHRQIRPGSRSIVISVLFGLAVLLPASWIRAALEKAWTRRQNDSFNWVTPPDDVARQISDLNLKWKSSA